MPCFAMQRPSHLGACHLFPEQELWVGEDPQLAYNVCLDIATPSSIKDGIILKPVGSKTQNHSVFPVFSWNLCGMVYVQIIPGSPEKTLPPCISSGFTIQVWHPAASESKWFCTTDVGQIPRNVPTRGSWSSPLNKKVCDIWNRAVQQQSL